MSERRLSPLSTPIDSKHAVIDLSALLRLSAQAESNQVSQSMPAVLSGIFRLRVKGFRALADSCRNLSANDPSMLSMALAYEYCADSIEELIK
jgi:hypothetical protein